MNTDLFLPLFFSLTVLVSLWIFYRAAGPAGRAQWVLIGIGIWMALQGAISASGFYLEQAHTVPPPFLLAFAPALVAIGLLLGLPAGRAWLDKLSQSHLTWLHTVRLPVELTLYGMFVAGLVPELMTFSGRNFDILAGLTAPVIAYLGFRQGRLSRGVLLTWNFVALGLVLFIVVNALLSAPSAFQRFAFEQPNIGVFLFPYIWLPSVVVPLVLLAHFASIRQLLRQGSRQPQAEVLAH